MPKPITLRVVQAEVRYPKSDEGPASTDFIILEIRKATIRERRGLNNSQVTVETVQKAFERDKSLGWGWAQGKLVNVHISYQPLGYKHSTLKV